MGSISVLRLMKTATHNTPDKDTSVCLKATMFEHVNWNVCMM